MSLAKATGRGRSPARGLAPEQLAALRFPGIVYVSLCAFSHVGPWASRRGFDTVVQNVSGITTRRVRCSRAEPGRILSVSAIDYLTGYLMAFGAMVALARRAREGSWLVRISLAQTRTPLAGRPRRGAGSRAEGRGARIHSG
jgi:crotonobetainyl-CoA:carnitine CoA-transferase CaiB-like acyl-CoA transferase